MSESVRIYEGVCDHVCSVHVCVGSLHLNVSECLLAPRLRCECIPMQLPCPHGVWWESCVCWCRTP